VSFKKLSFRIHALRRMFRRRISENEVRSVLATGELIEKYDDEKPYPSYLVLGFSNRRPIHVVAADNSDDKETIIITVYEPSMAKWQPGFHKRK